VSVVTEIKQDGSQHVYTVAPPSGEHPSLLFEEEKKAKTRIKLYPSS
jgi:hypothetical protein